MWLINNCFAIELVDVMIDCLIELVVSSGLREKAFQFFFEKLAFASQNKDSFFFFSLFLLLKKMSEASSNNS
jgi:hypothetical protein